MGHPRRAHKEISFDRELVFPGDIHPHKPMSNNTLLFALYRLGYRGQMTGHGFRGVAFTILHEQGWPHEHIELQAWADHLDRLRRQGMEAGQKAA